MPRKNPREISESKVIIECASRSVEHLSSSLCVGKPDPKPARGGFRARLDAWALSYGAMGCGGIVETHEAGGVRSGLAGTCVDSPGASASSAAREQLPPGMFHQLDVMGYAAVYEFGSWAAMQLLKLPDVGVSGDVDVRT